MTIRFFLLQAHYRSTVDFSNEALQAAEKGLQKLLKAIETLKKLKPSLTSTVDVPALWKKCHEAMDDDLNSPILLSHLFEGVKYINSANDGTEKLTAADIELLKKLFNIFVFDILGLKVENDNSYDDEFINSVIDASVKIRTIIKNNKDWSTSDLIRQELNKIGIKIKDKKEGGEWELE
jgi:cysteinyl-tRNA synthetase